MQPTNNKYLIGKRINVIGTTGSGKTSSAKKIAQKFNLPCVELDAISWGPDWKMYPDEWIGQKLKEKLAKGMWVVDGNYSRVRAITWANVETVVWLDYPFWQNFSQLFVRTMRRSLTKEPLWNTNNTESFIRQFTSKDSILYWFFKTYWRNKRRYSQYMNDPNFSHIQFVRIRSRKELAEWLERVELKGD